MRQHTAEMMMMPDPLDREYYEWLISQIKGYNPTKSYLGMFELMHNTEFLFLIPNDSSRTADGKRLRNEYFREVVGRRYRKVDLHIPGVSFLEVLVALSRRVAFQLGGDDAHWAWRLIKNLKLNRFHDPLSPEQLEQIEIILETVIWRNHDRKGNGGFFPVVKATDDMTKLDIWYQLQVYSMEIEGMK